jgi:hypothetical protein
MEISSTDGPRGSRGGVQVRVRHAAVDVDGFEVRESNELGYGVHSPPELSGGASGRRRWGRTLLEELQHGVEVGIEREVERAERGEGVGGKKGVDALEWVFSYWLM